MLSQQDKQNKMSRQMKDNQLSEEGLSVDELSSMDYSYDASALGIGNSLGQKKEESDGKERENDTASGLPADIKAKTEDLSGYVMDDVKVHYNSGKPAQLQAHAYTKGTDIYIAQGQEKYLPHEAWHAVQQKQQKVQPTAQLEEGVGVNTDNALEKEADEMGEKKFEFPVSIDPNLKSKPIAPGKPIIQLMRIENEGNEAEKKGIWNRLSSWFSQKKEIGLTEELDKQKKAKLSPEEKMEERFSKARAVLRQFLEQNNTQTIWSNVGRDEFADQLEELIGNPELINQADSGLCCMAAACKIALECNPEEFVKMAIEIYTKGIYTKGNYRCIAAPMYDLQSTNSRHLNPVEFIVLTTLMNLHNHNEFKGGLNYYDLSEDNTDTPLTKSNNFLTNIMEFKMGNAGKKKGNNYDRVQARWLIKNIDEAFANGHRVILTTNADHFRGNIQASTEPNHNIELRSININSDNTIDFMWWSWGKYHVETQVPIERFYMSIYSWRTYVFDER